MDLTNKQRWQALVQKNATEWAGEVDELVRQYQERADQTEPEQGRVYSVAFAACTPQPEPHILVQLRCDVLGGQHPTHWLTFRGIDDRQPQITANTYSISSSVREGLRWLLGGTL